MTRAKRRGAEHNWTGRDFVALCMLAALAFCLVATSPAQADEVELPPVPRACRVSTTICIDTTFLALRYVRNGTVLKTMDIRIGASKYPTDLGLFRVYRKALEVI